MGSAAQRSHIDRENQEPLEEDEEFPWPEPTGDEEVQYYFVEARLLGDAVKVDRWGLHPALRGRLLTSDVSRDGVQSGIATGRAGLSTALPLETVTWLAILDLYRNRGKETQDAVYKRGLGKYQSSIKSQSKDLDSGDESRTLAATKELSAFLVNPLIDATHTAMGQTVGLIMPCASILGCSRVQTMSNVHGQEIF